MVVEKEAIARLRQIPVEIVRVRLGLPEVQNSRIQNAIDVLVKQSGLKFDEAVKKLAEMYPDVASGVGLARDVDSRCARDRRAEAGVGENTRLKRTIDAIIRQFEAFGVERAHIYVHSADNRKNYSSRKENPNGISLNDLLKKELEKIAYLNVNGGNVFFAPIHPENKISIMVDDVKQDFIEMHRPSVLMMTSDRSCQAHYLLPKQYEIEFYDFLTKIVNSKWGDPKIVSVKHDTRLAGFTNQKRPCLNDSTKFPYVEIVSANPMRCESFEAMADELYLKWKKNAQEQQSVSEKRATEEEFQEFHVVPIPEDIDFRAKRYKTNLMAKFPNCDRSRVDFMVCKKMHESEVDPNVIYSWLLENACQTSEKVWRRHSDGTEYQVQKNVTPEAIDRYVRRTVKNSAFMRPARIEETEEEKGQEDVQNSPAMGM